MVLVASTDEPHHLKQIDSVVEQSFRGAGRGGGGVGRGGSGIYKLVSEILGKGGLQITFYFSVDEGGYQKISSKIQNPYIL